MKKVLSVMTAAAVLAATLTGCAAKTLSEEEYQEQAAELIGEYLNTALSAINDASEELSDLEEDFDKDALADAKEPAEKSLKEADEYLNKLEKLNPPEEMKDLHEDIVSCIEDARDLEAEFLEIFDAKNEDKLISVSEKWSSSLEKLSGKIEKIAEDEDNDWLVEELEDSKFMEEFTNSNGSNNQEAKVTSANQTAKSISDIVTQWLCDLDANLGHISEGILFLTVTAGKGGADPTISVKASSGATYALGSKDALPSLESDFAASYHFKGGETAAIRIGDRRVKGVAYSADGISARDLWIMFPAETFSSGHFSWSGKTDGVIEGNKIVGTWPVLTKGN